MPAEQNPITDAARLAAENADQSRQIYKSILQQSKQQQQPSSSVGVLARNTCSSVTFTAGVAEQWAEQQQARQTRDAAAAGDGDHSHDAAADGAEPAAAETGQAGPAAAAAAAPAAKGAKPGKQQPANLIASMWSKAQPKKVCCSRAVAAVPLNPQPGCWIPKRTQAERHHTITVCQRQYFCTFDRRAVGHMKSSCVLEDQ